MVRRLVGFSEYGQALRHFDELVRRLTPSELEEVNQFVSGRDEFGIYTNLSRRLELAPSSLSDPPPTAETGDQPSRGLPWVMGLARVELASMLATFTSVPDPFVSVGPTPYEMDAYHALLLDGARTHYWALVRDPQLAEVMSMRADNSEVLSYSRRLVLARSMLGAAIRSGIDRYSPVQLRELASWKQGLDGLQSQFVLKIQTFLEAVALETSTKRSYSESQYLSACGAMLRAEKQAVADGTAIVTQYPPSESPGNRAQD